MDNNVLIALIGASSSGLVAITALVLSYRGFISIAGKFCSTPGCWHLKTASMHGSTPCSKA
jgi:hypothetical protein